MKIIDINKLSSSKDYQLAIVQNISNAYKNYSLRRYALCLADVAKRKLNDRLADDAWCTRVSLGQDINLNEKDLIRLEFDGLIVVLADAVSNKTQSRDSDQDEPIGWYRLDFLVISDVANQTGNLSFPLARSQGCSVRASISFINNVLQTVVLPISIAPTDTIIFDNTKELDKYRLSFTLTPLSDQQVVEQMCELGVSRSLVNIVDGVFDQNIISENFINQIVNFGIEYLNIDLRLNGINSLNSEIFLKRSISSFKDLTIDYFEKKDNRLIVSEPIQIEYKLVHTFEQLGFGVELYFDVLQQIGSVLVLHGWLTDPESQICAIRFIDFDGSVERELFDEFVFFERTDVVEYLLSSSRKQTGHNGFACAVSDTALALEVAALTKKIEILTRAGKRFCTNISVTQLPDNEAGLAEIMRVIPGAAISHDLCEKLYQRIFSIHKRIVKTVEELCCEQYCFNHVHDKPQLAIIIPLFGKTRFELTQIPTLAALGQPDWELIFAVDDLEILEEVKRNVCRLAKYYGVMAKVIAPNCNLGFADINNFAVKRSEASTLLFLNSDCFLSKSDSILRALDALVSTPTLGAVGFRLLYADRTIQHDGMAIERWSEQLDFFINAHPRQGMPSSLIPQRLEDDSACMLTAACLLMSRSVFDDVGGFDSRYFMGDFEDSDICLKIRESGKQLGIVRGDDIYHLERQSINQIDGLVRQRITMTNSYVYSAKWKRVLEAKWQPALIVV